MSKLNFSDSFCVAELIGNARNQRIDEPTILINAGEQPITTTTAKLGTWKSAVVCQCEISGDRAIALRVKAGIDSFAKFPASNDLKQRWMRAYDVFQIESLRNVDLWMSSKDCSISGVELNLWYASAGTNCGIHNKHNFLEIHTQLYGIGVMQQFKLQDHAALCYESYMAPGITHEPFFDKAGNYPWHQYRALTDCIWLAIEFHNK